MEETIFISYGRPKDYFSSEVCILAHNVPRLLWWSYGLIFFSNIVAVLMTMGVSPLVTIQWTILGIFSINYIYQNSCTNQ